MTQRFEHGLVIGKFYPPHSGHHRLISTAAMQCDQLTVLVMAAASESIPGADRAQWLSAVHADEDGVRVRYVPADAPVDYDDENVWNAQVALMRAASRLRTEVPIDAVFSGESYGEELAARFGAIHVPIDPARTSVPISGTRVRSDLVGNWHWLAPATRSGLAVRAVVVGAESTGTTTIAEALTAQYRSRGGAWEQTRCVAEYGREYTEVKWAAATEAARKAGIAAPQLDEILWTTADFDDIGEEQTRREEAAARDGSPLLVCDTDAFATSIWERRYLGPNARAAQPWATGTLPRHDIYFLTSHEGVPWHDDGMREGDLDIRAAMTDWFAEELTRAGHSWVLLTGDLDQRVRIASAVLDRLLGKRLSFAASITELSRHGHR